MRSCFFCKKHLTETSPHALAVVYKPPELRFHGGGRIRAIICIECIENKLVIKYKKVITDSLWTINPNAIKKEGEL